MTLQVPRLPTATSRCRRCRLPLAAGQLPPPPLRRHAHVPPHRSRRGAWQMNRCRPLPARWARCGPPPMARCRAALHCAARTPPPLPTRPPSPAAGLHCGAGQRRHRVGGAAQVRALLARGPAWGLHRGHEAALRPPHHPTNPSCSRLARAATTRTGTTPRPCCRSSSTTGSAMRGPRRWRSGCGGQRGRPVPRAAGQRSGCLASCAARPAPCPLPHPPAEPTRCALCTICNRLCAVTLDWRCLPSMPPWWVGRGGRAGGTGHGGAGGFRLSLRQRWPPPQPPTPPPASASMHPPLNHPQVAHQLGMATSGRRHHDPLPHRNLLLLSLAASYGGERGAWPCRGLAAAPRGGSSCCRAVPGAAPLPPAHRRRLPAVVQHIRPRLPPHTLQPTAGRPMWRYA